MTDQSANQLLDETADCSVDNALRFTDSVAAGCCSPPRLRQENRDGVLVSPCRCPCVPLFLRCVRSCLIQQSAQHTHKAHPTTACPVLLRVVSFLHSFVVMRCRYGCSCCRLLLRYVALRHTLPLVSSCAAAQRLRTHTHTHTHSLCCSTCMDQQQRHHHNDAGQAMDA